MAKYAKDTDYDDFEIPCAIQIGVARFGKGIPFSLVAPCIERHNDYLRETRDENRQLRVEIKRLTAELARYREAEEQGRLAFLPCRINAKIYEAGQLHGKVFQRYASVEDMLTKIVPGWGGTVFPYSRISRGGAKAGGRRC